MPKVLKTSVQFFAISQGRQEGWRWFLACREMSKIFSNRYYHFSDVWPCMSKLPKITSLLFLCNILRKKWMVKLIFCMQIIVRKCVLAPPFFFSPPFLIPPFFRNMQPPQPHPTLSWHHPSRGNTRFYDDMLESGRLKTINIKSWKPITYRNCVS